MLTDFPVFTNLKTKLKWHQQRQSVLAENVANADTPKYEARELRAPEFGDTMRAASVMMVRTSPAHLATSAGAGGGFEVARKSGAWEITPEGNGVVLEEQMMKVSENQMDFQVASSLYSRAMSLLRIAATGQR